MSKKLVFLGLGFVILISFINWVVSDAEQEVKATDIEKEEVVETSISVTPIGSQTEDVTDDEQYYCLALNIYHESRGDSLAGQAAVADVVMNRVESEHYPDTVCEVVQQSIWIENWKGEMVPKRNQCQFSWFCDGVSDEPGDPDAWLDAYYLAQDVYNEGVFRGITEQATHYHAAHMRANWVNDRGMQYTGTIGQHEFYRWNR